MSRLKPTTMVSVLVVSGVVAYCFGYATGLLGRQVTNVSASEVEESLGVPEDLEGFRGMLVGVIAKKGEREFIIEVVEITRTWKANKAENPQAAVGKKAVCELWPEGRLYERHRRTLAGLKAGDRVLIEPFHLQPDHDHLTVVEELRKID
jgi:hypothetical protein